jgi:hypothetical protein
MISADLVPLLTLSSHWVNKSPPLIVIAGGAARSGTTFLEAILQAHPQIICFQEFMPLKTPLLAQLLGFIEQSTIDERKMRKDSDGRHWRGYGPEEDNPRMVALLLACLTSTTSANAVQDKNLDDVRVLFCKTPSAEFHLKALHSAVPSLPLYYVHCIREPLACMRSNWEMPWVISNNLDSWVRDFAAMLGCSADAVEGIRSAGVPVHVLSTQRLWSPSLRQETLARLFSFLGVSVTDAVLAPVADKVDTWPAEKRRRPEVPVQEAHKKLFQNQPGLKRWLTAFSREM